MYVPKKYRVENDREIEEFILNNPFAVLITHGKSGLMATHIPLLFRKSGGDSFLVGHISKGNLQKRSIYANEEALAIFHGPHSYISSSWYEKPDVPTWNYQAVHIYGQIHEVTGEELFLEVEKLVDYFEQGRPNRIQLTKLPDRLVQADLKGIVGFRMGIEKIEATFKLSQNRSEIDQKNIVDNLANDPDSNSQALSEIMKKRL